MRYCTLLSHLQAEGFKENLISLFDSNKIFMVTEKKEIILSLHIAQLKTYVVDYFFIVRYCMKVSKTCIEKLRFSLKSCQFHMCLKLEYKIKLSPFSRPVTQSDCLGVCPISFFMSYSKKLPQKEHFIECLPFDYIIPICVFCF